MRRRVLWEGGAAARQWDRGEGSEGGAAAAVRQRASAAGCAGAPVRRGAVARWCGVEVGRASALMRPKTSVADQVARKAAMALRSTRPTDGALSHCRESRPAWLGLGL